jgi:uncharacterized membrane protein YfcA
MAALWFVLYVLIGLGVGVISGILGIGGGVILVPILMWCGFKYRRATGTTLAVLVPPIGLPAAWKAYEDNQVDLAAAICIACAFAVGAYCGRFVVDEIDEKMFKLVFGLFMMFIAMRFVMSGNDEVRLAVSGLIASALGLFFYVCLYLFIGRSQMSPPSLRQQMRTSREEGHTDPDYYI